MFYQLTNSELLQQDFCTNVFCIFSCVEMTWLTQLCMYLCVLLSMQALLRKANLVSQMTIERKEKELLFEGGTEVRRRFADSTDSFFHKMIFVVVMRCIGLSVSAYCSQFLFHTYAYLQLSLSSFRGR